MLDVLIGGQTFSLDDGTICRLLAFDGWGKAEVERISRRGAQQHGDTDAGYRLEPRLGTLVLGLEDTALGSMYDHRAELLDIFRGSNDPKLRWTLPNGQTRQIDCQYWGDLSMPWEVKRWGAQKMALSLKCSDPNFYDPSQRIETFPISAGGSGWAIPWSVPWSIGGSGANATLVITYTGTFYAEPIVKIEGPITDPEITNEATGEVLSLAGHSIGVGEWIEIDCRFGKQTVLDQNGVNRRSWLTGDLATFHITDSYLVDKINTLKSTGTGAGSQTRITVRFYTRFDGI